MIYTDLTKKALKISFNAHKDQLDKSGMPYVYHPFHLAEQMYDEYSTCVALLHDVVEDTDTTLDDLAKIFPKEVTKEVLRMAQRKLLTNGNAFKRTDNRWGGVVWYMDEQGERKRKSFSGTTKLEVNKKMKDYMLNTGMRTGEELGLLNRDVDIENRVLHLNRGVKEIARRKGTSAESGREVAVGKLKSATSKRSIPLNDTAIEMIKDLRKEFYFGEDSPLIPDENGDVTRPVNFRKRYYRILKAAGIETKGLHSLRHTFATNLVNGKKDKNGNVKSLTPRQVADLLGHTTSEITEMYYVKRDMNKLNGITDGFEL